MPNGTDENARDTMAADETAELISSEKVEGTAVYDRKREKIGSVHHLMINKYTGQVAYAVVSFGGFLGIGSRLVAVPYDSLNIEEKDGKVQKVVLPGASRDQLKQLAEFRYVT